MKKINLQFIPTEILFIIGKEKHNKFMDKRKLDSYMKEDGRCTSIIHNLKGHRVVICVEPHESIYETKALIVHEISHCVTMIFDEHGFKDDELRSYLMQYIYSECVRYFDSKKVK